MSVTCDRLWTMWPSISLSPFVFWLRRSFWVAVELWRDLLPRALALAHSLREKNGLFPTLKNVSSYVNKGKETEILGFSCLLYLW